MRRTIVGLKGVKALMGGESRASMVSHSQLSECVSHHRPPPEVLEGVTNHDRPELSACRVKCSCSLEMWVFRAGLVVLDDAPTPSAAAQCSCSSRDLWLTGHQPQCPARKR